MSHDFHVSNTRNVDHSIKEVKVVIKPDKYEATCENNAKTSCCTQLINNFISSNLKYRCINCCNKIPLYIGTFICAIILLGFLFCLTVLFGWGGTSLVGLLIGGGAGSPYRVYSSIEQIGIYFGYGLIVYILGVCIFLCCGGSKK